MSAVGRNPMGRAEKILVFAIFGVVALILGITAFLPDQSGKSGDNKGGDGKSGTESARQRDPKDASGTPGSGKLAGGKSPSGVRTPLDEILNSDHVSDKPSDVAGGDAKGAAANGPAPANGLSPNGLGAAEASALGAGRLGVRHPANPNYVLVKVRGGETFSQIVQRECGSLKQLANATNLNEGIDVERLTVGQELTLPYVPADQLPAIRVPMPRAPDAVASDAPKTVPASSEPFAHDAPDDAKTVEPRNRGGGKTDNGKKSASLTAPVAASSYKAIKGDTLWGIAAGKYGKAKAPSKIQEILALNKGTLKDADSLKEGQVIKLP